MKSSSSTRSSVIRYAMLATWPLVVVPVLIHAPAAAARTVKTETVALAPVQQAWPGKRVILILPLRTGANWNANPDFTQMFLPQAQAALREALGRTNKFSLLEVRRFNPVLMRAVQDGAATTDDLNTLLEQPTVPNASVFLAKTSFNRAPLQSYSTSATIGSFVLESVQQNENGLRLKMTGRMYDPGATTAARALSATVTVLYNFASGSARTPGVVAANVGFDRVLQEFTRYPSEREMPVVSAFSMASASTTDAATVTDETTRMTETVTTTSTTASSTSEVVLPGTPIAGASSRPLTSDGRASVPTETTIATTTMSSTMSVPPSVVAPTVPTITVTVPGVGTFSGITVETETPPAEVFPSAPSPVSEGGGDGTESAEGVDDTATTDGASTDDTAVVDDSSGGDSSGNGSGDNASGDGGVPDADNSGDSSSGDSTGDSGSDAGGGSDSNSDNGDDASSDTGDEGSDEMSNEPGNDGNDVTTIISPRIRDRAPGETPSFER